MGADKKVIYILEDNNGIGKKLVTALGKKHEAILFEHATSLRNAIVERLCDLLILDVMCPEDEASLMKLRRLEDERNKLRAKLLNTSDTALDELRDRIRMLDREIRSSVNFRGGVDIIRDLVANQSGNLNLSNHLKLPVLFLTARSNPKLEAEGLSYFKRDTAIWLVKPVSLNKIEATVARLFVASELTFN